MNDKYESIKSCDKCNIIIKPQCLRHNSWLLEKYSPDELKEMDKLKEQIKVLKNKLVKLTK